MDVFTLDQTQSGSSTILNNGNMINGLDSIMWVERYRDSGEFTFIGNVANGYGQSLAPGTFVSHTGTTELMRVENHEIDDDGSADVKIKITGRSFETFMEERILTANLSVGGSTPTLILSTPSPSWLHAKKLIDDHLYVPGPYEPDDAVANARTVSTVTGIPIVTTTRELQVMELYPSVLDLLAENDLGIRSLRPGPWNTAIAEVGPSGAFQLPTDFGFEIHNGVDRRREVGFSYGEGDVKTGQYLWSNKKKKNSVIVQSKWFRIRSNAGPININRSVGYVDAKDLDDNFAAAPTAGDQTRIVTAMHARAAAYLGAQKDVYISRIELNENNQRYTYRTDYNVGDIVGVDGNYDTSTVMRVAEFVEIQDETGYVGYPTLSSIT